MRKTLTKVIASLGLSGGILFTGVGLGAWTNVPTINSSPKSPLLMNSQVVNTDFTNPILNTESNKLGTDSPIEITTNFKIGTDNYKVFGGGGSEIYLVENDNFSTVKSILLKDKTGGTTATAAVDIVYDSVTQTIYIATPEGLLVGAFDSDQKTFSQFTIETNPTGDIIDNVNCIIKDPHPGENKSIIYFGTIINGFYKYTIDKNDNPTVEQVINNDSGITTDISILLMTVGNVTLEHDSEFLYIAAHDFHSGENKVIRIDWSDPTHVSYKAIGVSSGVKLDTINALETIAYMAPGAGASATRIDYSLYVGTTSGLYVSEKPTGDSPDNLEVVSAEPLKTIKITALEDVVTSTGDTLYIGTETDGLYYNQSEKPAIYTKSNLGVTDVYHIVADKVENSPDVYVAADQSIYVNSDLTTDKFNQFFETTNAKNTVIGISDKTKASSVYIVDANKQPKASNDINPVIYKNDYESVSSNPWTKTNAIDFDTKTISLAKPGLINLNNKTIDTIQLGDQKLNKSTTDYTTVYIRNNTDKLTIKFTDQVFNFKYLYNYMTSEEAEISIKFTDASPVDPMLASIKYTGGADLSVGLLTVTDPASDFDNYKIIQSTNPNNLTAEWKDSGVYDISDDHKSYYQTVSNATKKATGLINDINQGTTQAFTAAGIYHLHLESKVANVENYDAVIEIGTDNYVFGGSFNNLDNQIKTLATNLNVKINVKGVTAHSIINFETWLDNYKNNLISAIGKIEANWIASVGNGFDYTSVQKTILKDLKDGKFATPTLSKNDDKAGLLPLVTYSDISDPTAPPKFSYSLLGSYIGQQFLNYQNNQLVTQITKVLDDNKIAEDEYFAILQFEQVQGPANASDFPNFKNSGKSFSDWIAWAKARYEKARKDFTVINDNATPIPASTSSDNHNAIIGLSVAMGVVGLAAFIAIGYIFKSKYGNRLNHEPKLRKDK